MKILGHKKTVTGVSAVVAAVLAALIYFALDVHYNNLHVGYHSLYAADSAKVENRLYTMWNVIRDKYSIKEDYFEEFREIAKVHADAFGRDGAVAQWIHTNFRQLDASVYLEVMQSIESERLGLENSQNDILNVCKFHNDLVTKRISCWFIADKTPLAWELISSGETREIMNTRRDERSIETLKKK
ncbi:MAG: hypothetical protein LBP25_00500 [Tannerellaceae bacterium]|jgi:hypothetical protein|nr:hypothetical protein [Tannerellaceae bacterium]